MKLAILGDIHGNLEALTAVLADAKRQGVDEYVSVGDIVGYNANPTECLALVRELGMRVVQGNHDYFAGHDGTVSYFNNVAKTAILWTREQLSPADRAFLRALPLVLKEDGLTLVHGTLVQPETWPYLDSSESAAECLSYLQTRLCFCGHTHVPYCWSEVGSGILEERAILPERARFIVNVGSVGQPRDGDFRAAYVIYDQASNCLQLRRVVYDLNKTQSKIRAAGLPAFLAWRLGLGR